MATVKELKEMLDKFNDHDCVIIGDKDTGWSNAGELKQEGSCVCIMRDDYRPFSSDRE